MSQCKWQITITVLWYFQRVYSTIWIIMKIFTNTWKHTGLFWWTSLKVFASWSTLLCFCKLAVHSSQYTVGNNTDNAGRPHTTPVTWSIPLMFSFHADVLRTCTASPILLANVWLMTWHKSLIFIKLQTCLNIILKCFQYVIININFKQVHSLQGTCHSNATLTVTLNFKRNDLPHRLLCLNLCVTIVTQNRARQENTTYYFLLH